MMETNWGKEGIWARITNHCSLGTDEWETKFDIFHKDRVIGEFDEYSEGKLILTGEFDLIASKEIDEEGEPKSYTDMSLCLTLEDLQKLVKLMEWWQDEDDTKHKDIWVET